MTLRLKKRGQTFHVEGMVNGTRIRKSCGEMTREQAERYLARVLHEAMEDKVRGRRASRKSFAEAAQAYTKAGHWIDGVDEAVAHFGGWWCDEIRPADVSEYAERFRTPSMFNRKGIAPVRAVLNFANQRGWRENPIRVRGMKEKPRPRFAVDVEWINAFLAQARAMGPTYHGYGELMAWMFMTGARLSEAVRLEWDDIDWETMEANIGETKNGERYTVAIPPAMVPLLERLVGEQEDLRRAYEDGGADHAAASAGDGAGNGIVAAWTATRLGFGKVFGLPGSTGVHRRIKEICERGGLPHASPHQAGRHSFATRLANEFGWQANDIARAGHWKDPGVVQRHYIHSDKASRDAGELMGRGLLLSSGVPVLGAPDPDGGGVDRGTPSLSE